MNEPMRTQELKFFRRADDVERDSPVEKAERRALFDPGLHVRHLEVG